MNRNRVNVAENEYQGDLPRVLTVCSAGVLRSPTIAWVLSNDPYNCNVRAVGIYPEFALITIDEVLIHWARIIVCAEEHHKNAVENIIKNSNYNHLWEKKPIIALHIPDDYKTREKSLIRIIEQRLQDINFKELLCKD